MRYVVVAAVLGSLVLAGCGARSIAQPGIVRPAAVSCTPAPVPPPTVALLGATASTLTVATWGYVTSIGITPSVGGISTVGNVVSDGTPGPDGSQAFTAALPAPFNAKTTYAVTANVTVALGDCPEYFYNLPAGTFTTP